MDSMCKGPQVLGAWYVQGQDQEHTEVEGETGKGQGPGESGLQPKGCGSLWKV